MDEMMMLRMFGGSVGSGFDLAAIIAFVAFAAIYLVVPVIGYRERRPFGMTASLYVLVGYCGLSLLQMLVQWGQILDRLFDGRGPMVFGAGAAESAVHIQFFFAVLKMAAFLVALLAFIAGLRSLRLRETRTDD